MPRDLYQQNLQTLIEAKAHGQKIELLHQPPADDGCGSYGRPQEKFVEAGRWWKTAQSELSRSALSD